MGLLDILNGMQNGPRGQRQPAPSGSGGGMSPMMMALLGLLAYKAVKGGGLGNIFGGGATPAPTPAPGRSPQLDAPATGGGLGDILGGLLGGQSGRGGLGGMLGGAGAGGLGGLLGGLLSGGAAGNTLNTGMRNMLHDLESNGQGDAVKSWVSRGANQPIDPNDLAQAAGIDTIDTLSQQTGMPRDDLLSGLSQQLPELVDQLTPDGRLPTEQEASRWV
jgi:uncharacterized protein YidB (DUF937 family)